jgi:hypothetical protein
MVPASTEALIGPIPARIASCRLTAFDLCSRMITASTASNAHLQSAQLGEEDSQCLSRQSYRRILVMA